MDGDIKTAIAIGEYAKAWHLLTESYGTAVFRYCHGMLNGDTALAEDLAQQALVAAGESFPKFRGTSAVKTWLLGIAHNMVRREIRTRQQRGAIISKYRDIGEAAHIHSVKAPDVGVLDQEQQTTLNRAINTLEPTARSIVLLRYGIGKRENELAIRDIADILGLSRSDAYRRLNAALAQLKKELSDDLG